MRAILINPQNRTITEVDYNGDYKDIYRLIGCGCFDCVRIGDKHEHAIFVDDEGLINGKVRNEGMFRFAGDNPAYLAGRGLILATDEDGESVAATLSLEWVKSKVSWGNAYLLNGTPVFEAHDGTKYYMGE